MIQSIRLQNFRSYADESFEFDGGVNIIVGPNTSGKTNLLEAIGVVSLGKSFRAGLVETIAHEHDWARLEAKIEPAGTTRMAKILKQDNGVKREFEINTQKISRLSLPKTIPTVIFEPTHLMLLNGEPALRREYLDGLLEQTNPEYAGIKRKYQRALAQRNSLLKRGHSAAGQLFAWDVRLSELGAVIAGERQALTLSINKRLNKLYGSLAGKSSKKVTATYLPCCSIENYSSGLLRLLETRQKIDLERGFTSVGPQREDWTVEFDGKPASETASRGEARTALLALKLIEGQEIETARNQKPILLLDDVFSELDGARRRALTESIKDQQVFITTTDADIVVEHFMQNCRVIPLQN